MEKRIAKNTKKTRNIKENPLTKQGGIVILKNAENAQKNTRQVCERSVLSRQVLTDTVRLVPFLNLRGRKKPNGGRKQ